MTQNPNRVRNLPVEDSKVVAYPNYILPQEDDTIDFFEILRTLWSWKWLFTTLLVLGTIGSYGWSRFLPKTYEASVMFLTEDETSLRRIASNPKLMLNLIEKEKLKKIILNKDYAENKSDMDSTSGKQAAGILLSGNTLSFEKVNLDFGPEENIVPNSIQLKKLPNLSILKVRHSDPESTQILANRLPGLLNQYSINSEQKFYLREKLNIQKQIINLRKNQAIALGEIESLGKTGVSAISLMEGGNDINVMTQLKLRLGEKLADLAIASASNEKEVFLTLQSEVKALDKTIHEQEKLLNRNESLGFKLKGKQQIYQALIEQESILIAKKQKVEETLSNLKNRSLEMLSTATVPESPVEPKIKLIVALTAVVSLFVGIFLVFIIEFFKSAQIRMKEKEEGISAV